jgi:hypothetical protein
MLFPIARTRTILDHYPLSDFPQDLIRVDDLKGIFVNIVDGRAVDQRPARYPFARWTTSTERNERGYYHPFDNDYLATSFVLGEVARGLNSSTSFDQLGSFPTGFGG